jgi:hypothetical protein
VVTLDDNLAILGATTHTTTLLKVFAQRLEVGTRAYEATHNGSNTASLESVEPYLEILTLGGEGFSLGILRGGIVKVGVGGEDNTKTLLPIVSHNSIFFGIISTKL